MKTMKTIERLKKIIGDRPATLEVLECLGREKKSNFSS